MIVILRKATEIKGKVWPVNTVYQVADDKAKVMIEEGTVKRYYGEYPPRRKHKMNLSQLNTK